MTSSSMKLLICLALASAGCRSPQGPGHPASVAHAAAQGAKQIQDPTEREAYIEGFRNGASMVDAALRMAHKPYFLTSSDTSALQAPTGPLPPGAKPVERPPEREVDLATGLPLRVVYYPRSFPTNRGQIEGFQWALATQTRALTEANLIVASPIPPLPDTWSPWPEGKEDVVDEVNHRHVFWSPGILAWEFNDKGFPVQRVWRHAPDWLHPKAVAFQGNVLWVKTERMGAVALDLTSGLIRNVQALPTAQPVPPPPVLPREVNQAPQQRADVTAPPREDRVNRLRREASAGVAESMYQLAKALDVNFQDPDGRCPRFMWTLEAARRGHVKAMMDVAGFYYSGIGVPKDLKEAQVWSDRAAGSGNPDAVKANEYLFPKQQAR